MRWVENPPSVVLVAKQFNPSVISQAWLMKQGILDAEGTLAPNSIFTENLVQVIAPDFALIVFQDQLQFVVQNIATNAYDLIRTKLIRIVDTLPHIPYKAVGLNFNWHLGPDDGTIAALSRSLFAAEEKSIFGRFADANARFGAYMSKDVGQFRLRLDIKPLRSLVAESATDEDWIQFMFNFHSDLPREGDAAGGLIQRINQWPAVRDEALLVMRTAGFNG